MNDRHPSGTPLPTAPAPDASYGYHTPYDQQESSYGAAAYDGYATGTFDHLAAAYGDGDPLFGAMPGSHDTGAAWDTGAGQPAAGYDAYGAHPADQQGYGQHGYDGGYDTTGTWNTTGHQQPADIPAQPGPADASGDATGQWGTGTWPAPGQWDTGQWDGAQFGQDPYGQDPLGQDPLGQDQYGTQHYGETHYGEGVFGAEQYAAGQYGEQYDPGHYGQAPFDQGQAPDGVPAEHDGSYGSGSYETTTHYGTTAGFDPSAGFDATGQWDAAAWQSADAGWDSADGVPASDEPAPGQVHTGVPEAEPERTAAFDLHEAADAPGGETDAAPHPHESGAPDSADDHGAYDDQGAYDAYGTGPAGADTHEPDTSADEETAAAYLGRPADAPSRRTGGGSRSRRRAPAKRSALLTVAVPSVAVMGVAGIAAASVGVGDDDSSKVQAAADKPEIEASTANSKLDTQLATVTADADDFADRASRTQERIDLKKRQAEEKKRKAQEAARKEALRPKFALPVTQHGLSAYYGQAGVNWMSVHSGIDFPVSYGTPVMAATDGTVRTEYNISYGNMAIVTAPDGTETWYCHLSSTKIRSGSVKAGDTIAYSGNSGNSTGPHLHFEVHPGGGSAINPLPWFQEQGLDPQ